MPELYIGLMSGTSLDGIDAVLVSLEAGQCRLLHSHSHAIPPDLRNDLLSLCQSGEDEIERLGRADRHLGETLAQATLELLNQADIPAADIRAIGSHGQTIRHRPTSTNRASADAFTLQIGDPTTLAEITGITTVADFRRRDIAAGGQGAPLVPAFHQAVFARSGVDRVIVNIGGMANLTLLEATGDVLGFDTGPGNVLLDAWIKRRRGLNYDDGGTWARSGQPLPALIEHFLQDQYFAMQGPKSTGREQFNLANLEKALTQLPPCRPEDVQQSLLQITTRSIANAINAQTTARLEVYICGGGAHNTALLEQLAALLPQSRLLTTAALGIDPDWVEAMAFAWLAKQCLDGLPGNVPEVTGASGARTLGAIYPA